ncbi:MAG TPA: hypothetical protein VL263_08475 [Vicinamibacterales bacterium]|nr:hypothetical protein [Vicinamibacterales bacterium]
MRGVAFWRSVPPLLLAVVVASIVALSSLASSLDDAPLPQMEIDITAPAGGIMWIFHDRGLGLREEDATGLLVPMTGERQTLVLPLRYGVYSLFRLDPGVRDGRTRIHRMRIVDGSGHELAPLPLTRLSVGAQATLGAIEADGVAVTVAADDDDPQLLYTPLEPIAVERPRADIARALGWFVGVLLAILCGWALVDRSAAVSRVYASTRDWAAAHARAATIAAGVVGSLAAMYPLLLGRSLVSPDNGPVYMLYDEAPYSYGARVERAESARGADVGAMMWAILPYTAVQRAALAAGELPFWNRYNGIGEPLWGQGQTFILDPFHLASLLIPDVGMAMDVRFVVARAVFAIGTGMAVLATTGNWPAAVLLAAVAPFVGHFTARFNHPAYFSLVYAPWILWAYARLGRSTAATRWRPAAALAAATALQLVGTTPKEGLMALLAAHVAGLGGLLLGPGRWQDKAARLDAVAVAGVSALLLSAPHWLIFLDTLSRAMTASDQPAVEFGTIHDLAAYVLGPLAHGTVRTGVHPLALMAALPVVASARRVLGSGPVLGAALSSVLLFAIAFGAVPAAWLLALPMIGNIQHIDDACLAATIPPVLVLAGAGIAWLTDRERSVRPMAVAVLVTASAAGAAALAGGGLLELSTLLAMLSVVLSAGVILTLTARWPLPPASGLALLACSYIAIAAGGLHLQTGISALDAILIQPGARADLDRPAPALQAIGGAAGVEPFRVTPIESVMFPGTQALWNLESLGSPDALRLAAIEDLSDASLIERTNWGWRTIVHARASPGADRLLDMVNVRFAVIKVDQVARPSQPLPQQGLDLLRAVERRSAWPRAFAAEGVARHVGAADFAARLRESTGPFASVDERDAEAGELISGLPANGLVIPAVDYAFTPNSTQFRVNTTGSAVAVLSEAFVADDFEATLNGAPTPYFRVNHALKGVRIPAAGTWIVRFVYRPARWGVSIAAAAIGAIVLVGLLVAGPLQKHR